MISDMNFVGQSVGIRIRASVKLTGVLALPVIIDLYCMPRLAFITDRFPPDIGGLATSSARISRIIAGQGIGVDVIAFSRHLPGGHVVNESKNSRSDCDDLTDLNLTSDQENYTVYRIGKYRNWDATMGATMGVLEWLHTQHRYNAIWGNYLVPSGFLASWFGALHGIPSTVSSRGNDIDRDIFPPGDFARILWTLERAHVVSSVSADIATKIGALTKRKDVIVLKNSVDISIFSPDILDSAGERTDSNNLRASLGIHPDELVLGFCGELREKKGLQFLLRALSQVRSQRPACMLLVGDVRIQNQPEIQLFSEEHSEDARRLIVTGHLSNQEQIAQHLRICDVYLQPSLFEGMPNALLEAMACGCLCIGSDAGGMLEVINHGVNGFVLPRAQLHNLGLAVIEAIDLEPSRISTIRKNARLAIEEKHSIEVERTAITKILSSLNIQT